MLLHDGARRERERERERELKEKKKMCLLNEMVVGDS
jgi:hypothetical protein